MTALITIVAAHLAATTVHTALIPTLTDQVSQLKGFLTALAEVVLFVAFIFIVHKKSWAVSAIFGAALVGGLIWWAINGGLEWFGAQISGQLGS